MVGKIIDADTYSVHRPNPIQINSPYRLRREIYWPDAIDVSEWQTIIGQVKAAETIGFQPRAF